MNRFFKLSIVGLAAFFCACTATDPSQIRIITFNLRNASDWATVQDGENCWANRQGAVLNMLSKEKPDAMGVQECLQIQDDFLSENLAGYGRIGVGRDDGVREGEMMTIYYNMERLELLDSGNYWLSETPDVPSHGWDGACNRMVTWGYFKVKGTDDSFYYFNTHLDHVGKVAREESIKLIVDRFSAMVPEGVPYVLTGDFNSTLDEAIYVPLRSVCDCVRETAPVTDSRNTYNAYGNGNGAVIDHVFSRNLKPLALRTLDGDYGVPFISDHYPVEADLQF